MQNGRASAACQRCGVCLCAFTFCHLHLHRTPDRPSSCMRVPPRYKARSLIHLQPTADIQAAQQTRRQQRTMTRTTHKAHPTPGFPVYCMDWADNETVLLGGGGGASRSGIENKIVRLRLLHPATLV